MPGRAPRDDDERNLLAEAIHASFAADVAREDREWDNLPANVKRSGDRFIHQDGLFLPKGVSPEKATKAQIRRARLAYARAYRDGK
jgi:hypothetical protein